VKIALLIIIRMVVSSLVHSNTHILKIVLLTITREAVSPTVHTHICTHTRTHTQIYTHAHIEDSAADHHERGGVINGTHTHIHARIQTLLTTPLIYHKPAISVNICQLIL